MENVHSKNLFIKKNAKYSFKEFIHSKKMKIIHSKKIFIQVKNGLSPRATPLGLNPLVLQKLLLTLGVRGFQLSTILDYFTFCK